MSTRGKILWHSEELLIKEDRFLLFQSSDGGITWDKIGRIPIPRHLGIAGTHGAIRRLLRLDAYHAIRIAADRFIFYVAKEIFEVDLKKKTISQRTTNLRLRQKRPLSIAKYNNTLLFGEYKSNPEKEKIALLQSEDQGQTWQPIRHFKGIRHIHTVQTDPYTNDLWITTGDHNNESKVLRSTDGGNTFETVLSGSQQTRIIDLVFTEQDTYFGTDAPNEQNYIYRLPRGRTEPKQILKTDGTVFFGRNYSGTIAFTSAVEPSRYNLSKMAVLYISTKRDIFEKRCSFRKDSLPMKYFQYGQIHLPNGPGSAETIWITPFATQYHYRSQKIKIQ